MAEKDLPSNSDESDEDFVPDAQPSSEEEDSTSVHSEDDGNEEQGPKSRKRRKVTKKKKKKEEESPNGEESEEKAEKVTDVEALWADFKQDVNKMEKQIISNSEKVENKESSNAKNEEPVESNSNPVKAVNENKRRSLPMSTNSSKLGLSKILNQIGKKEKMSTLAKSKMDWNNFKKSEGIDEEIKLHNRGKDGYLDKQDFLQRTDLRQFEIEKQLRSTRRNF